jgi:hypothetical protein
VLTAGERIQEPCSERHRAALQELQLTPAQQQRMAAGWKFFQTLLAPLVAERQQLHAQGLQVSTRRQRLGGRGRGLGPRVIMGMAWSRID